MSSPSPGGAPHCQEYHKPALEMKHSLYHSLTFYRGGSYKPEQSFCRHAKGCAEVNKEVEDACTADETISTSSYKIVPKNQKAKDTEKHEPAMNNLLLHMIQKEMVQSRQVLEKFAESQVKSLAIQKEILLQLQEQMG
ncbi:hypothetical protein BGX27_003904 [Mortierella sp. AM989]|nr:hypothetical protein BGX27_003904 [Mortierella sp. AM989]